VDRLKSGTAGWVLLTALVLSWDYGVGMRAGGETLSSSFARATRHPRARWPVISMWVIITAHLFERLPEMVDPFHHMAKVVSTRGAGRE